MLGRLRKRDAARRSQSCSSEGGLVFKRQTLERRAGPAVSCASRVRTSTAARHAVVLWKQAGVVGVCCRIL